MSINSVNLQNQNKYCNYQRNLNYNYQPSDNFYTSVVSNPVLNQDVFEHSSNNTDTNQRIANLKLQYQTLKNKQGIIGDCVDWFKNLFNTKNCSNNIEKTINSLNENSTEEEIQAIEDMLGNYNSNQDSVVKGVASTGSMMAGGAVGAKMGTVIGSAIFPGIGTVGGLIIGSVVGAAVGAVTSIGINQIENMTDEVEHNEWFEDENLLKEAGEGALAGGSAVIMGGITQKVTSAVASKVGLTAAKYGGKTAMVALAEDGTAKIGSTIAKNALAGVIGSGTAAATVSGGSYILECAVNKDKDFSLTDFGTTAATSFAFGGLIGGVTGGIQGYKGANGYNVHQAEIKAEAQARIQAEAEARIRAQQAQEHYNKPFEEKLSNKSAEESARVFEAQGKSEYEIILDKQEALAMKNNSAIASSSSETLTSTSTSNRLSDTSLRKGTSFLAQEGTPEYDAIYNTVKESFVVVKSKEEAMEIFKRQFNSVDVQGNEVLVLNPSNPAKVAKNINTSNEYMSQWFAEANGLEGKIVDVNSIQQAISNCQSKQITIFVPDDCAVTGSSLIMNTANTINNLSIPEGTTIRLVYSPMIQSNTAEQAFSALSAFDFEMLQGVNVLSKNPTNQEIIKSFIEQHCKNISVSVAEGGIKTVPYYNSEYFLSLKKQNPEVAQAVEAILTNNGSATGFGRPGQSGVMIATPNAEGTLKCPNNNPYGAALYALAEGATPMTIKSPTGKNIAKWHTRLQKILDVLNEMVA